MMFKKFIITLQVNYNSNIRIIKNKSETLSKKFILIKLFPIFIYFLKFMCLLIYMFIVKS